jgi:hypothetical protein
MPAGACPYPFFIQDGVAIGALRSLEQDTTRPKVAHTWDGLWQ